MTNNDNGKLNFKATIDDTDFNRKLGNMQKGVSGLKFEDSQSGLKKLNDHLAETQDRLKESKKALTELNYKISETAAGKIQSNLNAERNALRRSIKEDEVAVNSYKARINELKASQTTLARELSLVKQRMQELSLAGKQNTKEYTDLSTKAKQYSETLRQVNRDTVNVSESTPKASSSLSGMFKTIAGAFGLIGVLQTLVGLIKGAFNTIVQFDSKLLDVSKTTGMSGEELKSFSESIRNLSSELKVVSVDKLLEYAKVAGQLGVKGSADILNFSEALAKLETASDISGEEGGAQIARFLQLTDGDVKSIENFGDEIVKLGNNFAATESEILKNSLAISQNTGVYKVGRQEALAYGTATKAIGVEAELTGASIGRTLGYLDRMIISGKNLGAISKITGDSVDNLKERFKTDATGVLYSFVEGLNRINQQGGSVKKTLHDLGITAERDQRVLGSLASGGFDVLSRAMIDVKDSAGSMQQEFETASGKVSNSIEGVKVSWENFILAVNSSENAIGNFVSEWMKGASIIIDWITRISTSWSALSRQAGMKGFDAEYSNVMKNQGTISQDEALKRAFKEEETLRKLNQKKRELEAELSDVTNRNPLSRAFVRAENTVGKELEKVDAHIGKLTGRVKAYRDISENINKASREGEGKNKDADILGGSVDKTKKTNSLLEKRLSLLDQIEKIARGIDQGFLTGKELDLAKVNEKYAELIEKAEKLGVSQKKLNELREKEREIINYKYETDSLKTSLESQKKDYEDFENFKKQVGITKATEMYSDIIDTSKNYANIIEDEMSKIDLSTATELEKTRYNELFEMYKKYNEDKVNNELKSLQKIYEETLSLEDKKLIIEQRYNQEADLLRSKSNSEDVSDRLKVLEENKKNAIRAIDEEILARREAERSYIASLTNYTKNQLESRLKSTKDFLLNFSENLSDEQKQAIEGEIQVLEAIIGINDQISRQNALLKLKAKIEQDIRKNNSKDPEVAKRLNDSYVQVNQLIEDNGKKTLEWRDYLDMALSAVNDISRAFSDTNKELSLALGAISNLVGNLASGNLVGAVTSIVGVMVQGVASVFSKNKGRQRELAEIQRNAQEDYNRMIRDQLLMEARINELYESRVQTMEKELQVLASNKKKVAEEIKSILNTLNSYLNSNSFIDAFLINNADAWVNWKELGIGDMLENGVELTDELFNKLAELNSLTPLKGYLKELYERLLRLKEEFGSIEEAMRQAEIEMMNNVTGTTAQALAESIRNGLANGKRSFADFADDIEGFLRNAILSGMSTAIIEPQIQQLQDMLYEMMKDGVLTEEERKSFEDEYARIAEEASKYLDLINQSGVGIGLDSSLSQGAKDGIKRITEVQADRLTGILTGMQVDVIESRKSLQISNNLLSSSLDRLVSIDYNTRRTADGVEDIKLILQNNQLTSLGM